MIERSSRAYAYLGIAGIGDKYEITRCLGLNPSRAYSVGEPRADGKGTYRATHWQLNSDLAADQYILLDEHINSLLTIIDRHREQIRTLQTDFKVWIGCVAYYVDYQAGGLHLDLDTLRKMADLGLELDFDIYCECDEDPPLRS